MEQKTINVYKFSELSKDVQQKVIEKNSDINVFDEWYEFIIDDCITQIKEKTALEFDYKDIEFELFSRTNQISILSDTVKKVICRKYHQLIDIQLPRKFGCYTNYLGGGLSSGLRKSEIDFTTIKLENEEDEDLRKAVREKMNEKVKTSIKDDLLTLQDILAKTFNNLYETHEYLTSEEAIKE